MGIPNVAAITRDKMVLKEALAMGKTRFDIDEHRSSGKMAIDGGDSPMMG